MRVLFVKKKKKKNPMYTHISKNWKKKVNLTAFFPPLTLPTARLHIDNPIFSSHISPSFSLDLPLSRLHLAPLPLFSISSLSRPSFTSVYPFSILPINQFPANFTSLIPWLMDSPWPSVATFHVFFFSFIRRVSTRFISLSMSLSVSFNLVCHEMSRKHMSVTLFRQSFR